MQHRKRRQVSKFWFLQHRWIRTVSWTLWSRWQPSNVNSNIFSSEHLLEARNFPFQLFRKNTSTSTSKLRAVSRKVIKKKQFLLSVACFAKLRSTTVFVFAINSLQTCTIPKWLQISGRFGFQKENYAWQKCGNTVRRHPLDRKPEAWLQSSIATALKMEDPYETSDLIKLVKASSRLEVELSKLADRLSRQKSQVGSDVRKFWPLIFTVLSKCFPWKRKGT